jgi:Transcriptional regulators
MLCQTTIEVERELRRRILAAQYAPGMRIPPERELTETFGCSRGTVSKALAALESEGVVERRHGAGTFVAERVPAAPRGNNAAAEARVMRRGNVIKYLSPMEDSRVENSRNKVLDGMHEALDGAQFHVSIDFYKDAKECAACLKKLRDPQIAGVVFWGTPGDEVAREARRLMEAGVAMVMIDTFLQEVECDFVVSDNIGGAAEMVRFLAEQGHRDICYFTSDPDRSSLVDRLAGFLKGMVLAGLPFSADNVAQVDENLESVLRSVLKRKRRPSAIFASHDMKAISIVNALRELGVSVPEDISVVGYDGVDAGRLVRPALTTMEQDFRGMALKASQILLERLGRRSANLFYRIYVEPKLKVRKSHKGII